MIKTNVLDFIADMTIILPRQKLQSLIYEHRENARKNSNFEIFDELYSASLKLEELNKKGIKLIKEMLDD